MVINSLSKCIDHLLKNNISKTVKKNDGVRGDAAMAVAVVHGDQKLSRFEQSLGGTVTVAIVFHNQPGNNLFHPIGDLFTFCHRIKAEQGFSVRLLPERRSRKPAENAEPGKKGHLWMETK